MAAQAGWYVDPRDARQYRYWDGERWSQSTQPIPGEEPAAFTDTTVNASLSAAGTAEPVGSGAFDQALGSGAGLEPTADGTIADFMWTSGFGDNDDSGVADSAPDMFATDEAVAAAQVPSIVPAPPAPAPAPPLSPVESLPVFEPLGATPAPAPAPAPLAPRESPESALPAFSPSTATPPPPPAPVPTPVDAPSAPTGGGFVPSLPSGDQGGDTYAAPNQPLFGATAGASAPEFAPAAPGAELSAFPAAPLPAPPAGGSPFPNAPAAPSGPKSKVDLFTLPEEAVGVPTTRRSRLKSNKKFPEAVAPVMDPNAVPVPGGPMGAAAPPKEKKAKRGKGDGGAAPRMPSKVAGSPGPAGPTGSGPKSKLPMLLGVLAFIVLIAGAYFLFFADSGDEDVATDATTTSAAASPTTTAKGTIATEPSSGATTAPGSPSTTVAGATTTVASGLDEATAAAMTKAFTDEATRACDLIKADPGLLTEAVIQYDPQWAAVNKTYEDLQRSVNDCSYAARDEALKRVAAADQAKGG